MRFLRVRLATSTADPQAIRDYYGSYPPYNLHGADEKERGFERRVRRINRLMPRRGRLLDVGSGLGYFLKVAQLDGWDVTGLEPQESAAKHCRDCLGIDVRVGMLQDQNFLHESFDVVTLWDVLEHVHNPIDFLCQCIELVAPGGLLVIAIPNASGWPARLFRGQWRYVMFTHLNYFTTDFIRELLANRGLRVERTHHTIKVHSLVQGVSSWFPFEIDTEQLIRLGRSNSVERGRPEMKGRNGRFKESGIATKILQHLRRAALEMNLMGLPASIGDLIDLYCRKI